MQTVSYKFLIDLFAAMSPVTLSSGALSTEDATAFNRYVNRALRRGWEWIFWPELMDYEQRYYRASYAGGTTYAIGDEVYYATTAKYYRATAAGTGNVPTNTSYWAEITGVLDAYVAYEQAGATAFSHVAEVWNADYRTTWPAHRVKWEYDERGIRLTERTAPPSVWVRFRMRAYTWRGADYSAGTAYASGVTRYYASGTDAYEGDFWTTTASTSAGESPASAPTKWTKLAIPAFLADFATAAASLGFREGQTKLDQALIAGEGLIWTHLYDERAKLSGGLLKTASAANLV